MSIMIMEAHRSPMTTWLMMRPANEPLRPVTVKKRRKAIPSTAAKIVAIVCLGFNVLTDRTRAPV